MGDLHLFADPQSYNIWPNAQVYGASFRYRAPRDPSQLRTQEEINRARGVLELHAGLNHPSDDALCRLLDNGGTLDALGPLVIRESHVEYSASAPSVELVRPPTPVLLRQPPEALSLQGSSLSPLCRGHGQLPYDC